MRNSLKLLYSLRRVFVVAPFVAAVVSLASCDKVTDLKNKVTEYIEETKENSETEDESYDVDSFDSTVSLVGESQGKSVIASEERLVILEFYSDT